MGMWILSNVALYIANKLHAFWGYKYRMSVSKFGNSLDIYFYDAFQNVPIIIRTTKGQEEIRIRFDKEVLDFFALDPNTQMRFILSFVSDYCNSYSLDPTHGYIHLHVANDVQFDYDKILYTYNKLSKKERVESDYPLLHWVNSEFEFNIAMETMKYLTDVRCDGFPLFSYDLLQGTQHLALNIEKKGRGYAVTTKSILGWNGFLPESTINLLWKFLHSGNYYSQMQTGEAGKNVELVFTCNPEEDIIRIERFLNNGLSIDELKRMIKYIHNHLEIPLTFSKEYYEKCRDTNLSV